MLCAMRTLLLVVLAFAAGFFLDRWQHRPIVIQLKPAAVGVSAEKGPAPPEYWEGGGGRLVPSNFSCVQSLAKCWWTT
jgi:hypothetical protein